MSNYDLNDFFGEFPDRPDVPEFWALSEVVLRNDGAAEEDGPEGFLRIFGEMIDPNVASYVATQRSASFLTQTLEPEALALIARLKILPSIFAIWVDGFVAGGHYVDRHGMAKDK